MIKSWQRKLWSDICGEQICSYQTIGGSFSWFVHTYQVKLRLVERHGLWKATEKLTRTVWSLDTWDLAVRGCCCLVKWEEKIISLSRIGCTVYGLWLHGHIWPWTRSTISNNLLQSKSLHSLQLHQTIKILHGNKLILIRWYLIIILHFIAKQILIFSNTLVRDQFSLTSISLAYWLFISTFICTA